MLTIQLLLLAMQVPGWCAGCHGGGVATPGGTGQQPQVPVGSGGQGGPGDTVPASPGAPRPAPPGGPVPAPQVPGPRIGGGATTPSPVGPTTAALRPQALVLTSDDGWWLWWEHNKTEYLEPKRRPLSDLVLSLDGDEVLRGRLEAARSALFAIGEAGARDADAGLRQAAVIALGRVGEIEAHEELLAALADPSQEVRHAALLALGATGTTAARATLSEVALRGCLSGKGGRISPYSRPLAVVALGLGRRAGFDEEATTRALEACERRDGAEGDMLLPALFIHHMLAPDERIVVLALGAAQDERETPATRCRAIEALSGSTEPRIVDVLAELMRDGRMDLRRSAALALAACPGWRAYDALRSALEQEQEPLTRGLVLASLARRSEPGTCKMLVEQLKAGQANQLAWAALAVGIHARSVQLAPEDLSLARCALRRAREGQAGDYALSAFDLAAGLLRDVEQYTAVHEASTKGPSPERRNYAMTSMSLYGDQAALDALAARVLAEGDPVARLGGATALAVHGRAQDGPILLALLRQQRAGELRTQAAQVLGLHGSSVALEGLMAASIDAKADQAVRAAAVEGLGILLTRPRALAFADVSRQANYTVLPEWVRPLFYTTL